LVTVAGGGARELYFSFFMFTANLRPDDHQYTEVIIRHIAELTAIGYDGFDLPIAPTDTLDHSGEVESYKALKQAIDEAGLGEVAFTTNVGATSAFDPSSADPAVRERSLAYLKSRVDITVALGGKIMAGPVIFPYNVYPKTATGESIWSDALKDWVVPGYQRAQPVLNELGDYAEAQGVAIAIEPVDHWETPAPNMVSDVESFLEGVSSRQVGVCIDSAHVMLGNDGPGAFSAQTRRLADAAQINYVHISAPDRGAVHDSWIFWTLFLSPILACYEGPLLIETFNAVPAFLDSLRLTRRKFLIPGEDTLEPGRPDAYTVARESLATVREEIRRIEAAAERAQ
jgi:sugar phosphate isomerase/epimerase